MRDLTAGRETVSADGVTVRQVIESLDRQFPGMKQRLCNADGLRPGIAVIVDGIAAPLGWLQPVRRESEVHFLPAIGGGGNIDRPVTSV
jgi:molybdopterin synthase sulfur carrier subunit